MEEWKNIPGTAGKYRISNYGRMRSFMIDEEHGRTIKELPDGRIRVGGKYYGRMEVMVARLFLDEYDERRHDVELLYGRLRGYGIDNIKLVSKHKGKFWIPKSDA